MFKECQCVDSTTINLIEMKFNIISVQTVVLNLHTRICELVFHAQNKQFSDCIGTDRSQWWVYESIHFTFLNNFIYEFWMWKDTPTNKCAHTYNLISCCSMVPKVLRGS